ncbi:MAG: glycoside hydrolase/phage tail family protein [Hyphomicrobiaceae bacterium]
MATLALAAAGAAVGGALLPAGVSIAGLALSGAAIGSQVGALAGSLVDQALFAPAGRARAVSGPRLSDLHVTASTEGAPIPRLYGRARLGGQVIWATPFEEEAVTASSGGSAKGGASRSGGTRTDYVYYGNFAVGIAEGEITGLGRVWADGAELDLSDVTWRLYTGSDSQLPDSLIEAAVGAGAAPAYRGLAYIVFERLPLAPFGNRLPQLSFEIVRAVDPFESQVRGVCLIPGAGEFVYAPDPVTRRVGRASSASENVHTRRGTADWGVALDQLQATLPNARSVSLFVSWFGTDLRAAHCTFRPGVDSADKVTQPQAWSVAGLARGDAHLVSLKDGRAAYGGTPSDASVIAAIRDLNARGLDPVFTPFVLMDIGAGNALADPYTGAASQPLYPWRGRITCDPAPGVAGSPDRSPAAATQIAAVVGTAVPSDFAIVGESVVYSGPAEWSLRRMLLHYAHLCVIAGGVDAFVLGSELRGLTQVRDGAASYPFVAALASLAADVRSVLGPGTKITYAADWSEYFGHQPPDGSGDVHFHLDPLWASGDIDAVGIDLYWPLADWRDGRDHADWMAGVRSACDLAYLKANIFGGEGFDWYYASDADRAAQVRSPITDGAGKPWTFRYKDIRSWWGSAHYDRPGGIESATPTAWVPQSKPFWIMEVGCGAVDKGANQPNVFVDPKSSESALPHFSRGTRDDLMQRRYLQAIHEAFDPASPGYVAGANPVSALTGARMLDLAHVHVYAWDARPYPAFPNDLDTWGDGDNWRLGHWITGRLSGAPLDRAVSRLLDDYGFADHDAGALAGTVGGLVIDRVMSARDALQPLELAYFFDARESDGRIVFDHRGAEPEVAILDAADLVEAKPADALVSLVRGQETDLPAAAKVSYIQATADYGQAVAEARRLAGASGRVALAELPLVADADQMADVAECWLFEAWAARERATFALPPSRLALEPGDTVGLDWAGRSRLLRLTAIGDHGVRDIEARAVDPDVYAAGGGPIGRRAATVPVNVGQPLPLFLDLPLLRGDEPAHAGYVAAAQTPWPGSVAVYRSPETSGYVLKALIAASATTGVTLDPLSSGPPGRFDHATRLRVEMDSGALAAATALALLAGANVAAVLTPEGDWEVFQFQSAELVAPATYELSHLLRAQAGTEGAMRAPLAPGARVVLIDAAVARIDMGADDVGPVFNWKVGPARRAIGDASYADATHAFAGVGLRPLSPVHVRGVRDAGGDLSLAWVRRTRIDGDSWDTVEVPLGEASERYEVDILSGATVVRTLASTTPAVTYTAADQAADFGAPPSSCAVRIHQLGATYGRGAAASATV